jgi:hypothetical protein
MSDTATPAFVGWRRSHPKARWFAVAWADTRPACWDALLRVATAGKGGESIVLEAGRDPDAKTPFRRGVR